MANHFTKTNYGQCNCLWCGKRRFANNGICGATDEMRLRIKQFADQNGRTWKSKLRALWTSGKDEGLLRQARNIIGPSGLDRVTPRMLDRVFFQA